MRNGTFGTRSFLLCLCVLITLVVAGPAWALGINFSVKTGAVGAPGTAVNAASDGADIYVGAAGNNVVRIPKAALGLVPGDEVDGLTIYHLGLPFWDEIMALAPDAAFVFSVDAAAVGSPIIGPPNPVFVEAGLNEAAGDIFVALWWMGPGFNNQVFDEAFMGLVGPGAPEDDLDALQLDAPPFAYVAGPSGPMIPVGTVAFSLAAGSPSLATIPAADEDVLLNTPVGPQIMMPGAALGIPAGDDLDALFVDVTGFPVFSVDGASGLLGPGDILVPDGTMGAPDGLADVLLPAIMFGLLPTDNVNALDAVLDEPLPPEDPELVDTDGDLLPDYWEEKNALDPNDDGSVDPDMGADGDPDGDGLSNADEYGNGTDPNDEDSDDDGLPDGWEVDNDLDPNDDTGDNGADGDPDGDELTNLDEYNGGTDPNVSDVPVAGVFTLLVLALAVCVIALRGRRKEIA